MTSSHLSRRDMLKRSAVTGAGIAATSGLVNLSGALPASATPVGGFGPLVADPAQRLDLPDGFSYTVIAASADAQGVRGLTRNTIDGTNTPWPNKPDGSGSFYNRTNKHTLLVQNHEITGAVGGSVSAAGNVPKDTGQAPVYDPSLTTACGGTTTMELDENANVLSRKVSIAGTAQNCAGGVTPWGSWITCEESELVNGSFRHGYCFEVDPFGVKTTGQPLKGLGRFAHEAVAIDPSTNVCYLTEDAGGAGNPLGLLYRLTPTNARGGFGSYEAGGLLEAMTCTDLDGDFIDDLSQITTVGTQLNVRWTPVPVPDPSGTGTEVSTRRQFPSYVTPTGTLSDQRVTRSKKLEGAWWGLGTVWLNCSFTKPSDVTPADFLQKKSKPSIAHDGQVWRFNPRTRKLTLVAYFPLVSPTGTGPAYNDPGSFDGPDNIVVSPFGGAFLCEDGDGIQHITGLDDDGTAYAFGLNRLPNDEEFTGATFSGEGKYMFVNTQTPGVSYAITGPWARDTVPPVVPEISKAAILPVSALALVGGAIALRNRRAGASAEATTA